MSSSSSFRPPPFQPLANLHAPFDPSLSLPPLQYGPAGAGPHPAVQVPLRSSAVPAGYQPTRLSHPRPQHHKMAYPHSDEELAHLQKLSNEFEPEVAVSIRVFLLLLPCAVSRAREMCVLLT